MCESYSRSLLRVSVAQVCQALGWDSVQLTACDLLTDVLQRYLQQLARGCHRYSELYGRTDPVLDDVGQAFKLMGVNLQELEDYIHSIEPVTFPHQIPSFPVSKNNVLQFPQPGSKDAEGRKEHIPDYLPPIVSSQEEEEEEQVPTDGGTSAEAMQVPLEEEEEMEEDEAINDENFLSKRPLESPEAVEMPPMKRPKLAGGKGDIIEGALEPREPLSSINSQKVPPMLSPVHVQEKSDLVHVSPEPPMLALVSKSQAPAPKILESKTLVPKTKGKVSSPGQKTKSPKLTQLTAVLGSPIRSPKTGPKEKKSPGRAKSPKSPKSPKVPVHVPPPTAKLETPTRPPLTAICEKMGKENIQVITEPTSPEPEKLSSENLSKKPAVADKTIEDSIDAVIARACAEREPDPFEFSSGSESEGDVFTSPKRLTIPEPVTPKLAISANSFSKGGSTPVPSSGGTSSSDTSWTMDDSINEVIRKANMGASANIPVIQPYLSSPSASPPTPEPLLKVYEEKTKLASSVEVKKKLKKELKTKMKKRERERQKDKEKRDRIKEKEKNKEKDKERDANKETKLLWKEMAKDDDFDYHKFKMKDSDDVDTKVKVKDGSAKKEKHKEKKKDREKSKKEKDKKVKDKNKEDKLKASSAPLLLTAKDIALPLFSSPATMRLPSLPSLSPLLPDKLFEEREKVKERDKKRDKKEKKKKRDKEKEKERKEKEKERKEKEKKEKEKHKHEKIKVEPVVPAPSPVIPRLTLRVGAGQDKIVISKVVPTPEVKPSTPAGRPKSPPSLPSLASVPVLVTPPSASAPPQAIAALSAIGPPYSPAIPSAGGSKGPIRSVVTETVSTYVIQDQWGNKIWICPGCKKRDDGSPMIGCDDCDDWYHWPCVGLSDAPPDEEKWFCPQCDSKKKDKKHKKRKHKAH
ncbi:transcription initiation factor TFIID subunit 3 isoform X2 [Rhinatrema bivittatum]|uniref:transcription initiation factor TFIID subunit 3 isoform X2 n=1 Tax=Rhinatrema bivittatum TaxID=194408 RepID=UPI0011267F80|nr:transcription initiation factor TFIID subunit 3 isoform X2 [Rhinatrema bivittatum]